MSEKLEIYDLNGTLLGLQDRHEFYKEIEAEYEQTGKITKKVKSIRLLLMNSKGNLYIQLRSDEKERNPGLFDKTIGGHLKVGHTWDLTVVKECHEELGFPAVVLTDEEFRMAFDATDLKIIGLVRKLEHMENFLSVNDLRKERFEQPFITTFYLGYYDGSINFCDGESTGIQVYSLKKLQAAIKKNPAQFTEDLKFMIKRYKKFLVPPDKRGGETIKGF
ncbi:NUDIX domain-containing protein [archaeon]|nr:NUDIX domain-containing protein [archaeon]MBL7057257.1 NUDIX domain-containing protein [Candidatus Woesearchaeota archaeon]